jgi:pimeloyl-ACP methyl ester carboxylesterase
MAAVTHHLPGLELVDCEFVVPLDHAHPNGEQITVFARAATAPGKRDANLPWLAFFQGGPGGKSPRPVERTGWLKRALEDYRVLLLDQRGTGRSSPVTHRTLARRGDPAAQAAYLMHFRADAIVRDAEYIRRVLAGPHPWSALGQSYGGFCITTYLSLAPEGLREAIITGGLPPIFQAPDDVYRATYRRVISRNQEFAARYPHDQALAQRIVAHLAAHDVRLPDGSPLTPHRFLQLGMAFGMSDGFEAVHYLLDEAFVEGPAGPELSDTFLAGALSALSFATSPLYAVLHEACYCQGPASRWSAQRVRAEFPAFDPAPDRPPVFTGEMIYPWMFDLDPSLQPLKEVAEILAAHEAWPALYDVPRLRANTVPVAAVIYYDDMYVERAFSEEAAAAIAGCRVWITNQYQHNGLRADGEALLGRLLAMLHGDA